MVLVQWLLLGWICLVLICWTFNGSFCLGFEIILGLLSYCVVTLGLVLRFALGVVVGLLCCLWFWVGCCVCAGLFVAVNFRFEFWCLRHFMF